MITSQGGKTSGQEKQQVGILEAGPRDWKKVSVDGLKKTVEGRNEEGMIR